MIIIDYQDKDFQDQLILELLKISTAKFSTILEELPEILTKKETHEAVIKWLCADHGKHSIVYNWSEIFHGLDLKPWHQVEIERILQVQDSIIFTDEPEQIDYDEQISRVRKCVNWTISDIVDYYQRNYLTKKRSFTNLFSKFYSIGSIFDNPIMLIGEIPGDLDLLSDDTHKCFTSIADPSASACLHQLFSDQTKDTNIYFTNAYKIKPDQTDHNLTNQSLLNLEIALLEPSKIVVLGNSAAKFCDQNKIKYDLKVPHPAWIYRYRRSMMQEYKDQILT